MFIIQRSQRQNPSSPPSTTPLTLVQRAQRKLTEVAQAVAELPPVRAFWSAFGARRPPETQAEKAQASLQIHRKHTPAVAAVAMAMIFAAGGAMAQERVAPVHEPTPIVATVNVAAEVVEPNPVHVVHRGESLWSVGKRFKVSEAELRELNPEVGRDAIIYPGQELKLPKAVKLPTKKSERGYVLPAPVVDNTPSMGPINDYAERPVLRVGSRGPIVARVETRLSGLGYLTGPADGQFDGKLRRAVRAFQMANHLHVDGVIGPDTWGRLTAADAVSLPAYTPPDQARFRPGAQETITLFTEAARRIGVPEDWARSSALRHLLDSESDGWVGRPNYTYGARHRDHARWGEVHAELRSGRITADSSATGLGQLLLRNVDDFYPSGRAGIGDPLEEAIGMLAYIEDRYGSPQRAWRLYNRLHEGY